MPGWIARGDEAADRHEHETGKEALRTMGASEIDPVQAMASYYLLEFVSSHNGSSELAIIAQEARSEFDALVSKLDPIFRTYAFCAIGGELRHHYAIRNQGNLPGARSSVWDYWHLLGINNGFGDLTEDAIALFADADCWDAGFGGYAWKECAKVLAAREDGRFSPAIFCDRVFSLQHNGGSFLNKFIWKRSNLLNWSTDNMQAVGDAHAATKTDWTLLLALASGKAVSLFRSFWKASNRLNRETGKAVLPLPIGGSAWDYAISYARDLSAELLGIAASAPTAFAPAPAFPIDPWNVSNTGCVCEMCQAQKKIEATMLEGANL